jgi:hypothetical protein
MPPRVPVSPANNTRLANRVFSKFKEPQGFETLRNLQLPQIPATLDTTFQTLALYAHEANWESGAVRYLTGYDRVELRKIGDRAQERVVAEHTSERRAREFEICIEKHDSVGASLAG